MHSLGSRLKPGAVLFSLVFTGAIAPLQAQQPAGEIRLEVKDPSGAAVVASGTLRNPAGGRERTFQTDTKGKYRFPGLPFGRYRLEISKSGFTPLVVPIDVQSATPVSRTVTLSLSTQASRIDVIAATPLAGTDLTTDQIAGAVQTATATDIQNSGARELGDFMSRRLNGVYLNEMQGNPFQPDVNFRGYTASPLLGTPEGISVYLDGVRQNQPFGDVVSWDLIPQNAISEITFMPGSDPLFGLNTLGGALSVQTKNGVSNPGFDGSFLYGSSNRKQGQGTYGGGKAMGFNWFLAGNIFHESGWRFDSPSNVKQGFARLGWRTPETDIALAMSFAYNTLIGNGLQDYRRLENDYSSVYSIPDSTANRSPSFSLIVQHTFRNALTFSGNAWYRYIRTSAIDANFNDDAQGQLIYQPTPEEQAVLSAAGYTGFPTSGANISNTLFPKWPCIAEALQLGDPDQTCDGVNIYSLEVQHEFGASGQITWTTSPKIGRNQVGRNQFTAGASVDRGSVDYTQTTNYAYVNPDYTLTSVPAWQDGSTRMDGVPIDSAVSLHGVTPNWSVYFTDTLTLSRNVNVTVSGRYNRFTVDNTDRINPIPGPDSLDGDYIFQRFNPAIGITWSPFSTVNAYASFSQGSRAPTSIELGCANPEAPCSLPNSLSSDPPLQQVVTDTWEAGLRGKPEIPLLHNVSWNAGAFRTENHNDILFVAAPQTGTGYFQNFAKTLREGLDANLDGSIGRLTWGLDWTFLSATYQSTETLDGSANNTNNLALEGYPGLPGVITVEPGDRIPLIPKQTGKAYVDFQATKKLAFDLDEVVNSSSYARGNENNAYKADGVYYLGPGVSPGYAITNFRAHYDLTRRLQLALQIDNLFNHEYYTAAWLSNTALSAQGAIQSLPFPVYATGPYAGSAPAQSATFFTPGAPRRAWVELGFKF
jgi:outer membrane receptor protein involved in Fe transport